MTCIASTLLALESSNSINNPRRWTAHIVAHIADFSIGYSQECSENVTHHWLCCTLQCKWSGWHSLNQVSHSGRSLPLHLSSDAEVPPLNLWFCGNPTAHHCFQWEFHWERSSSLTLSLFHQNVDNKQWSWFRRAGQYHYHQCPPGTQYCCSCVLCFWVKTRHHLHLGCYKYKYSVTWKCFLNKNKHM